MKKYYSKWDFDYPFPTQQILDLLIGRTATSVAGEVGGEQITITCDDITITLCHDQDCCETVFIESIVGDLSDLIGSPFVLAEERTPDPQPPSRREEGGYFEDDSYTWTFYAFATSKGHVDIRFYGSSNGYYSESVDIKVEAEESLMKGLITC